MNNDVSYLPIWKKNASVAERLEEIALIARKYPERFDKLVVLYVETLPGPTPAGLSQLRYIDSNTTTHEFMGICQDALMTVWNQTRTNT